MKCDLLVEAVVCISAAAAVMHYLIDSVSIYIALISIPINIIVVSVWFDLLAKAPIKFFLRFLNLY